MSTNKTENYHLHTWELGDDFLLSEINENFAAVDTVLRDKVGVVIGICTGDGEARQNIKLGFAPRAVLLMAKNGHINAGYESYGGLALPGFPVDHTAGIALGVTETGFYITKAGSRSYFVNTNATGQVSYYLAFR